MNYHKKATNSKKRFNLQKWMGRLPIFLILGLLFCSAVQSQDIFTYAGGGVGDGPDAKNASLSRPENIVVDEAGNLYITDSDHHRIRKVDSTGAISTIAGTGMEGYSGDGGAAVDAVLDTPEVLSLHGSSLYFTELGNHTVRKIDLTTGMISTVAGTGTAGYNGDGIAANTAQLNHPDDVCVDSQGNLYIADTSNFRIRKVDMGTGMISTIAGTGEQANAAEEGDAATTAIGYIHSINADSDDNLYLSDISFDFIRIINNSGAGQYSTMEILSETVNIGFTDHSEDLFIDESGDLFLLDSDGDLIIKISGETVSVVAGNGNEGYSGDGGPALSATFNHPNGIFVDSQGNIFVADTENNVIRKINASDGIINTIAGGGVGDGLPATQAKLFFPFRSKRDSAGNLYIADSLHDRIRVVNADGIISTFAGNGIQGYGGDGGPATEAELDNPSDIIFDAAGNVYISDTNNDRVRRVDASTGVITTFAGGGVGDGSDPLNAYLDDPENITVDSNGNIYISDSGNHRIRIINASSGAISTIAGNGREGYEGDGGPAVEAELDTPEGLSLNADETSLFFAELGNHVIRKVDLNTGIISTVAGDGHDGSRGDGGPALQAELSNPDGVCVDRLGNLYIADTGNYRIRKIDATTGMITSVAGTGQSGDGADGAQAFLAPIGFIHSIYVDSDINLYIADQTYHRIRRINGDGEGGFTTMTNIVGTGIPGFNGDGNLTDEEKQLHYPENVFVDSAGKIYIADSRNHRLRVVEGNMISTIAGNGDANSSGDGGPATDASLNHPTGVTMDDDGNIYITDNQSNLIRKIDSSGIITTIAGGGIGDNLPAQNAKIDHPSGLEFDSQGNLAIIDTLNHRIRKVDLSTGIITTVAGTGNEGFSGEGAAATEADLSYPLDIAFDESDNLYIVDSGNEIIRKVDAATGLITTIAGTVNTYGYTGDGGQATVALLDSPLSVSISPDGNLFIADVYNEAIRKIDTTSGIITTFAGGNGPGYAGDGGPAQQAKLNSPTGVFVDDEMVYITDSDNNVIRTAGLEPGTDVQDWSLFQ